MRIDSGYFSKNMVRVENKVREYALGYDEVGKIFSRFSKGIFDINASFYTETGIPFIRIGNLNNIFISYDSDLVFIPEKIHFSEKKTKIRKGDIVLSKTAYPAAAISYIDSANTSQDTIATSLSDYGMENYIAEFVVIFLNCYFGKTLSLRQFQGNVQMHLGLDDGRKIPIIRASMEFQEKIRDLVIESYKMAEESKSNFQNSEAFLVSLLGLEDWQNSGALTYQRNSEEVFSAERLDAEHFQEKYYSLVKKLKSFPGKVKTIDEIAFDLTNGVEIREYTHEGVPYLRISDISNLDISPDKVVFIDSGQAEEVIDKVKLTKGDVLISRSGSLAITAVVEDFWKDSLISSHLIRMRIADADYNPYYVAAFLGMFPGREQIVQWSNGGVQPEINQPSLKRIIIPCVDEASQQKIEQMIFNARTARNKSIQTLELAKNAVEIAIEYSETAALKYLAGGVKNA